MQKFESKKGQLKFGDYNFPEEGKNLLGSIEFQPSTLYTPDQKQTIFWLPINSTWIETATQLQVPFWTHFQEYIYTRMPLIWPNPLMLLQNIEMQQCLTTDRCLPRAPEIVYGLRTSTSDIYIQNAAYREYICTKFKASTVDEESAAVASVSKYIYIFSFGLFSLMLKRSCIYNYTVDFAGSSVEWGAFHRIQGSLQHRRWSYRIQKLWISGLCQCSECCCWIHWRCW